MRAGDCWRQGLALAAGCLLLLGAATAAPSTPEPVARQAVLDLSAPGATAGLHELRGDWGFIWQRFRDPEHPSLPGTIAHVPGDWNELPTGGKPPGPEGYGTYVLEVRCPEGEQLALMVPVERTAMRLYVNGRLAAAQGDPGASPAQAQPAIARRAILTDPYSCPLQITAHVSNYEHRAGGMIRAPVAGPLELLAKEYNQRLALDTLLVGAYLVLGVAPIVFWLGRRQDTAPLFTGLFCLAQMAYVDMMGDRMLLQLASPETPWETYLTTEYLAWFASMALFPKMADKLFPRTVHAMAVRLALLLFGLGAAAVVLLPARVFSELVVYGQVAGAAIALYVSLALLRATRHGRPDAGVLLAGMGFLGLVLAVNVVQFYTGLALSSITAFGQLAFVLTGPMVLLRRLGRALTVEELRTAEQREKVDLLVRATQAGILDWDDTRNVTRYSPRLLEIMGYPHGTETADWPQFFEHIHPEDRALVQDEFTNQLRDRSVRDAELRHEPMEYRLLRRDGTPVWVHAEAISVRGRDGRTLRYISSFLDITGHRQVAERLQRQNEALAENARLREDVERMSRHDLKTPLNSIIGVARLLREDAHLQPEQRELLAISERAGYRMLEMVNLSLDLHRMETGTYEFRPQAVNLVDVVSRVLLDLQSLDAAAQVPVQMGQAFTGPVYARAEELLCYSILANLLKNAIEATPPDSKVSLSIMPGDPVRVNIHNPTRVPAAVEAHFFEKYVTAGKSGGTGLGTYSARLMARVQEGELAMSTGSHGTVLTLTLRGLGAEQLPAARSPGRRPTSAPVAPLTLADIPATRVLLADDDEYNRLLLLRYLPAPPFTVDVAANGHDAIAAMERHWPDLVLIDMEMPRMNGLEAVHWIRDREAREGREPSPIVMMSSNDDPGSVRRGLGAGSNRYLTKPFTREALLAVIHELVTGVVSGPAPLPPQPRLRDDQPPSTPEASVRVDAELLQEVPAFLASRRAMVASMAQALATGDREQLRSVAHRAAGGLALFGFHWAAWQSRRISQQAAGAETQALERDIAALKDHLENVQVS
ncbi:response regulator [Ramlibacter sp. G-1-2-2]|uniref:histidine kinase n=1 Tax=Ramlibacter agri TaxID=2728837 RepID=A0A848H621_9BURK|nr:response regulator [Ramlibacter agri]NML44971.1 response regulator [Ramlibacter agri]